MRTHEYEEARPRAVWLLAWPILVSMASFSVLTLVDSLYVARLGTTPLAAVGIASGAYYLCGTFWVGSLGAVRIGVSQATGGEDSERVSQALWVGLLVAAVGAVCCWAMLPFSGTLLRVMGGGDDIMEAGRGFLMVRLITAGVVFLNVTLQGWFQGRGDTRTPMIAFVLGMVLNLIVDPLFIFGGFGVPAMGVTGAALATAVAYMLQCAWLVSSARAAGAAPLRPTLEYARDIVETGLPLGVNNALDMASFALFASMLASVGEAHVAAHVVLIRLIMMSFLPGYALGEATGVLVGQAVGSGRAGLARAAWWTGAQMATGVMGAFGLIYLLFPAWLVVPFGLDSEVSGLVITLLQIAAVIQVVDALGTVFLGALNGAGDTRFSMGVGLAGAWLVKLPLGAIGVYVLGWGVVGAWLGVACELVFTALICGWRIRGTAWLARVGRRPALA